MKFFSRRLALPSFRAALALLIAAAALGASRGMWIFYQYELWTRDGRAGRLRAGRGGADTGQPIGTSW